MALISLGVLIIFIVSNFEF